MLCEVRSFNNCKIRCGGAPFNLMGGGESVGGENEQEEREREREREREVR